jgi:hypothetical protein
MEQNLLIDSGLSSVDGDYELLKALGSIDDEETEIVDGYDKIEAFQVIDLTWRSFRLALCFHNCYLDFIMIRKPL